MKAVPHIPIGGNASVIGALEHMLAIAREGDIGFLIAIMVDRYGQPVGGYFGSWLLGRTCMDRLEKMCVDMDGDWINRTLPDRVPGVPADRVCYSLTQAPISHDFLIWLIDAEMTRAREGAPAPLKVAFFRGRDGKVGLEDPWQPAAFENMIRPMLALVGAVEDDSAIDGRSKVLYTPRDVCAAARSGERVPVLKAPADAVAKVAEFLGSDPRPPVVISLREAAAYDHRNSNLESWLAFAQYLDDRGERVVVVRDTCKADEPFGRFQIYPEAARNTQVRFALYESAKANLMAAMGPCGLCCYGTRPYLIFHLIQDDGHNYPPNTPTFWRDHNGVTIGGQWPWARSDQRIVWTPDWFDNIVNAWENLQQLLPAEQTRKLRAVGDSHGSR